MGAVRMRLAVDAVIFIKQFKAQFSAKGEIMKDLQNHVESIANKLTNGFNDELNSDNEPMSAFDYLQDALDIEYIIGSDGQYRGARILVAFGGPNIWIDTKNNEVEGYWWTDKATSSYTDSIGLNEALEELWNCR
jgi:hypothetical protein